MNFLDQARKLLTNFGQNAFNALPPVNAYNAVRSVTSPRFKQNVQQKYNSFASQPVPKPLQPVNKVLGNIRQSVENTPITTTGGAFPQPYKNIYTDPKKMYAPSNRINYSPVTLKDIFTPKSYSGGTTGKFLANSAEQAMGFFTPATMAAAYMGKAALNVPGMVKGLTAGAAIPTTLSFLKGEKPTVENTALMGVMGMISGGLTPKNRPSFKVSTKQYIQAKNMFVQQLKGSPLVRDITANLSEKTINKAISDLAVRNINTARDVYEANAIKLAHFLDLSQKGVTSNRPELGFGVKDLREGQKPTGGGERLLLPYIQSKGAYSHIKSLNELSSNDINIFTKQLEKEIKKQGIDETERIIRNSTRINSGKEAIISSQPTGGGLVPQKKSGWCGPTALSYAFKEQGFDIPQEQIVKLTKTTVSKGVNGGPLKEVAEKQGFKTQIIEGKDPVQTLNFLDTQKAQGKSVLLDFLDGDNLKNDGHYVVYQGRQGDIMTVLDPETGGARQINVGEFINKWKDTTTNGNPIKGWAMVMEKFAPSTGGGGGIPQQTQIILKSARERIPNFNEKEVLSNAQKIANLYKSKTIEPQHLAEALQYTQPNPTINDVLPNRLFENLKSRTKGFSGNEQYDRMKEIGITDKLNPKLPQLFTEVNKKIQGLDIQSQQLLNTYTKRLLTNVDKQRLTVSDLQELNNVLNTADKIKVLSRENKIGVSHIAEALQYRNLPELLQSIKGTKGEKLMLGRMKEVFGKDSAPSTGGGGGIPKVEKLKEIPELPYDPSRLEKTIGIPGTFGNSHPTKWEAQIRYKGFAADHKYFDTKVEAQKFLDKYEFKGMNTSVANVYKGSHFEDVFNQGRQKLVGGGGGGATYPKAIEAPGVVQTGRKLTPRVETAIEQPKQTIPVSQPQITTGGSQSNIPPSSSSKPIIPQDPIQKITQALKEAKPIRGEQEAMYTKARAQRFARASAMGQKIPGEQGYYAQLGQLKGEMPKVQFEGIRGKLTPEDINSVFQKVEDVPYFSLGEKLTAKSGLEKLLGKEGGVVPNKSELSLLNEIFPPEFIKAAQGNRTLLQKIWSGIGDVAAVPRSLMAGGFDMSYGLRQGVFSGYRHPKQWASAFKEQFKYFKSDKAIQELNNSIKAHPNYKIAREAGVSFTDMGTGRLKPREEMFQSNLAEKIPIIGKFVRASGRAYTGFSNKYRFDIFNDLVKSAKKTGDFDNPKFLKGAGELVNTLTGRGSLGKFEKQAGVLSSTLFSPRLLASRLQLMNPQFYMKLPPTVRRRAVESLVGFIAGTTTILGAAKLAGADVGTDMTSSDFGKIKVGNTRIDIMGGFSQPLVLLARLLTGKVTSSTTGKIMTLGEGYKPMTRFDMIQRFFESKEAPIVSFITSAIKGQNAIGEKFNASSETINRMIPMFIADMVELYKDGGLSSLPLGIPGFFGAGSQTYGKQELIQGINQLGEPTSQLKPPTSIGEDIGNKIFGQPPLGSTPQSSADAYYKQMLQMPKEEAAAKYDEIRKTNPELAKKIVLAHKDYQLGVTPNNETLRMKGVASGDRAVAISKEFNNLKTPQEKAALWDEYVKKKIITKEVAKQLKGLLK